MPSTFPTNLLYCFDNTRMGDDMAAGIYQTIVNDMFLARNKDREPDGFLHPSSLAGCERQAVYVARGEPVSNDKDIRNIRIMGNGTAIHEIIQDATIKAYPGTLVELDVNWGPIRGSADALLPVATEVLPHDETYPAFVYELQEYKSISPNGKRFLQPSRGNGPKHPPRSGGAKPEHIYQARTYYWGLSNQGFLLDGIRIVYIDRDDWSVLEFEIEPWTALEVVEFEATLDSLQDHIEEGTLPDRKPDGFWLCDYCDFRKTCKGIE